MEVWEDIAANAEAGARRLVAEYGDRLFSAAVRICGNESDAEDLVFRTLSHAIVKIRQYGNRCSFFSWLYSILANFHRMDMRKKGAAAIVLCDELPEIEDSAPNPADRLDFQTEADVVREATAQLPEPLREIIVLRYFEDLSLREISALLKLPLTTVKFRLHFAKRKLRAKLRLSFRGETASYGAEAAQ
ncbi:MAG: sigma-70 family RNA polymerase sigma factor [Kiritimatiellae bacterium]|nr:sigma-70 family RNA polymerase sigma factor [Kiritimatiellia bacterium]